MSEQEVVTALGAVSAEH